MDTHNPEWDEYFEITRTIAQFIMEQELNGHMDTSIMFDLKKMQAYIAYITTTFFPEMTEEANQVLKRYYQMQRGNDQRNVARTTIRLLESLIRLSQAHARLMCQEKVLVRDAVVAVMLVEASMHTTSLVGVQSSLHEAFPEDPGNFC